MLLTDILDKLNKHKTILMLFLVNLEYRCCSITMIISLCVCVVNSFNVLHVMCCWSN